MTALLPSVHRGRHSPGTAPVPPRTQRLQRQRYVGMGVQVFMAVATMLWITPVVFAFYIAMRPVEETNRVGYLSAPSTLTFDNFVEAWGQSEMWKFFLNSLLVAVPATILTLLLASMAAYVISRVGFGFNIALLVLFTAGNLLPPQVIITPLYKLFLSIRLPEWLSGSGLLYNSYTGLIVINVAFQLGFCVFVLSNYMRTLPASIDESAFLDGASVWTRYWRLTLPLCRPAMAALATLLVTWIYNDFFWAITLISTGDKRPVTSALANLQGQFVTNQNMIVAAALLAAVPTLLIHLFLQRQYVDGLRMGTPRR